MIRNYNITLPKKIIIIKTQRQVNHGFAYLQELSPGPAQLTAALNVMCAVKPFYAKHVLRIYPKGRGGGRRRKRRADFSLGSEITSFTKTAADIIV